MKIFQTNYVIIILLMILTISQMTFAVDCESYVSTKNANGRFPLVTSGNSAPLVISEKDYPGIVRISKILQADIERVTSVKPELYVDKIPTAKHVVLIGTLGKSPIIDKLVTERKFDATGIADRWDTFVLQIVENPLPDIEQALIIAGSNKRGTIYGMFDLSAQIGVSPWYWWADVPVKRKTDLFILPGRHTKGEPAVKYRGIFLNDEEPALGRWAVENYGGFNHQFYEKLFELLLRMKANYFWPAMWWASFSSDDPLNIQIADEMGIVVGTSHHEPMMRAHAEWKQRNGGEWNYETNEAELRQFWTEGIERMDSHESIVTMAMRGDGDMAMTEETNIALLERIVKDQREILGKVTGKDVTTIPQLWALYKEVQDYYDKGMRVPEDITLLLCDDNWGNIRKLPKPGDKSRSGGYGIYYHFDYVGGPRNYKWVNTNLIARVWEQMNLAYRHGVERIWLVNVGDLKPMEFPTEFFLDFSWNPNLWQAEWLPEYSKLWAEEQFGSEYAAAIAEILTNYTKYNGRRKPELLVPETYSLTNYREAETIVTDYNDLLKQAEWIDSQLPSEYKDSFFQLVLHPVKACANLNELYVTVAKNRLYAKQGRAITNELADKANQLFEKDAEISHYYNKVMANGKWNHMMDQTHIGYTYWQQPEKNSMPKVETITLSENADMGVAAEGSENWLPQEKIELALPEFDPFNRQIYYIEIFNRGQKPFNYKVKSKNSCLFITPEQGSVDTQQRIWVSVNWDKAPRGVKRVPITIEGPNKTKVTVFAVINNTLAGMQQKVTGFVESNGYVSMEAEHYTRAVNISPIEWQRIPNLGRTISGMMVVPVTAQSRTPEGDCPRLEYNMYLLNGGEVKVHVYVSPTLNYYNNQGLRYAISIDDETPQIINIHADFSFQDWEEAVRNSVIEKVSTHNLAKPGKHVLKFWMVDPGIVLQKIVVETTGLKPNYLGPPESFYRGN